MARFSIKTGFLQSRKGLLTAGLLSLILLGVPLVVPMIAASGSDSGDSAPGQNQGSSSELPEGVRDRILRYVSDDLGVPASSLTILSATAETWSDSCLGLGGPAELCAAVQTPGWRVEVMAGDITRVYRTNDTGQEIRHDTTTNREPDIR